MMGLTTAGAFEGLPPTAMAPALRHAVAAAVLASALPLLLQMPGTVSAGIGLVAVFAGWSALTRPLPGALRLLLVIVITGAVLVGFGFRLGRDAGSALMLSMLVLKLSELRDIDDARRLVGFALFAPFAAFLQDQGPLTLLLGLSGTVAVLLAMARLARWPHPAQGLRVELPALGRALLIALPLALVGFWLFPRLPTPLWGLPENALTRSGISETMSPGDWLDLIADDRPAFRVRFEGPRPPLESLYWRGPVLAEFDGRTWTRSPWLDGSAVPRLPQGPVVSRYTLTLEPTDRRYVFALESPVAWPDSVVPASDASLRTRDPQRSVAQYRLAATASAGYQAELTPLLRRVHLALPPGYNPRTRALAERWRSEAADPRAYIRRVLAWFHAEHAYSITAPPLGRDTVDAFLFDTREGYCEHFSSAFVVLMRAGGIPARVVTGYAGGVPNRVGGYWVVRQMDAHAWSEVWLEGEGWQRVDPTAAVAPERIYDTLDDLAGEGLAGSLRPMFDFGDSLREAWNNFVVAYDAFRQAQLLERFGWQRADPVAVGRVFIVAAGVALALTLLVLGWPPRGERDPLLRAWRGFLRRWARRGLRKGADETAAAFLDRLRAAGADEAATRLVARFEDLRYATPEVTDAADRQALATALQRYRPPPLRGD